MGDVEDNVRTLTGGRVYIAGSGNVFGTQYDVFTQWTDGLECVQIKQVSAGYRHTSLLSAEGELFAFGFNKDGCCGQPAAVHFIPKPTPMAFLYTSPKNLAFKCRAIQSTTYNERHASFAVNGRKEGDGWKKCTSTQQEAQPWIELDLGRLAIIEKIVVWNRTDTPSDRNLPADYYSQRMFPAWIMVGYCDIVIFLLSYDTKY